MSKKKSKDPFLKREKEKYKTPIPSREYILEVLAEFGRPIGRQELADALGIKPQEDEVFGYRLKAMLRDGQIMQDRKSRLCLIDKINVKPGRIHAHPEGFGFFIPDDGSDDMVISPKEMRQVMHGDRVLAFQGSIDRRGRPEAQIQEIIEHANPNVVGRFYSECGVGFVVPDNTRLTQDILVPLPWSMDAQNGHMVSVSLEAFPTKKNQAIGKVTKILGEHMAPGMETEVAIRAHGIPHEWPEAVIAETTTVPRDVSGESIKGRQDLRDLNFVTIDGEDARDFDDAVFAEVLPKGGFRLLVAIADVSHYVKPGSALDNEAKLRGNSVYFPGRVVPMLPEALSNGICSLNPEVDRFAMVADMRFSAEGKMTRSHFYRAVFHSKARLTYTEVAPWLAGKPMPDNRAPVRANIEALNALFQVLLKARKQRGAMDFDSIETRIEFDEQRKIKRLVPLVRNDAHRLIEECMLAANVAVADFLEKSGIPMLYRVHEAPDEDRLETLRAFLGEFGLRLPGGLTPHAKDFQQVIAKLDNKPEKHLIETVMLRSLKQAQYLEANAGHFGLAYPAYTHFTSPIRRYPDLLIHRAIGHILDNKPIDTFTYSTEEMAKLGRNASMTERRADEATREVVSWLKCEYMQDKLGQEFEGTISSVTGFGIFVELHDIYVEGLVHITSLKNDYYSFDPVKHRLLGERTGRIYRLGDRIRVLVARVDLDERKIDFEPVDKGL